MLFRSSPVEILVDYRNKFPIENQVVAGGDLSGVYHRFSENNINSSSGALDSIFFSFGFNGDNNYSYKHEIRGISSNSGQLTYAGLKEGASLAAGHNFIVHRTNLYNIYNFGVNNKWQLGRIKNMPYPSEKLESNENQQDNIFNPSLPTVYSFNPRNPNNIEKNQTDMVSKTPFVAYGFANNYNGKGYELGQTLYTGPNFGENSFNKVVAGKDFTIFLIGGSSNRHAVLTWGNNDLFQAGINHNNPYTSSLISVPTVIINSPTTVLIGYEDEAKSPDPNKVKAVIDTIKDIAAGSSHGLAINDSGELLGWGDDSFCQLMNSKVLKEETNKEIKVISNMKFQNIWAGSNRNIALGIDNNLYTWGQNNNSKYKNLLGIGRKDNTICIPTMLLFNMKKIN